MIPLNAGDVYKILHAASGNVNCLHLNEKDNTTTWSNVYYGGQEQQWRLQKSGKFWEIVNVRNNKFLYVDGEDTPAPGASVICDETELEWDIKADTANGTYRIFVANNSIVAAVNDGSLAQRASIVLAEKAAGPLQGWRFQLAGPSVPQIASGFYTITNTENDHLMDIKQEKWERMLCQPASKKSTQQEIAPLGPGYTIKSKFHGGYVSGHFGLTTGGGLATSIFPVAWQFDVEDVNAGIWSITWPHANLTIGINEKNNLELQAIYPIKAGQKWRLKRL
ncbi:hypothetical protein HGRIS_008905 [Hohenbuehelia grisea]|uniref:Ricin B lectin domain-containing protein n=1 Tax=Hohenbuehelia grisea TaxID=104357 RepID=A0ABR3J0X8_9AGAR